MLRRHLSSEIVSSRPPAADRQETPAERDDRNFNDLLQETRVLQTGVQILFGFLLMLAVEPRFGELSPTARSIYVVTLLSCCMAACLLMAPVAYHRALFGQGRKDEIVRMAHRSARAGMFAMSLALSGATLLVLELVFTTAVAAALTTFVVLGFVSLWYVLPYYRRHIV